jgi:hypothetical protein
MVIGEVKPQEDDEDCEIIEESPSATLAVNPGESREKPRESENLGNSGPSAGDSQGSQEDVDFIQQEASDPHPRVRQSVQRDHLVDYILGSIRRGVTTRSRLANFCEHYSFVSMLDPLRVEEALEDAHWMMSMQEELKFFTQFGLVFHVRAPRFIAE